MHKNIRIGLLTVIGIWAAMPAFSTQVFVTNFNKTGNMQTDLQASFPSGSNVCDSGGFGPTVCFNIGASNVNNYELVTTTDAINVSLYGVTKIYLLLNVNLAQNGQLFGYVQLDGTGGATQATGLFNGIDARDFFLGNATTTINGTSTRNFYAVDNVQGHQAVGFPGTITGNFRLDEVELNVSNLFLNQTLTTITIGSLFSGINGTPILAGITVVHTPLVEDLESAPEPGSIAMALGGVALIFIGRKRISR